MGGSELSQVEKTFDAEGGDLSKQRGQVAALPSSTPAEVATTLVRSASDVQNLLVTPADTPCATAAPPKPAGQVSG